MTKRIYLITREGEFARDFGLARQIQRAAISVMSHIAEGFERGDRGKFHRSLFIAKASCAEVRCQLYVAFDIGYLTQAALDAILDQSEEVARILGGLLKAVARPRNDP